MAIISHKHSFIFIHCRKTAGTSIEASLIRYLGNRDIIKTGLENEPVKHPIFKTRNITTKFPYIEKSIKKIIIKLSELGLVRTPEWVLLNGSHIPAKKISERFKNPWQNYLKFCVIRNTYDRVISQWRWEVNNIRNKTNDISLDRFLDESKKDIKNGYSSWYTYTIDGEPKMDDYINFDNLNHDLKRILNKKIGINFDGWMPKKKSNTRREEEFEIKKKHLRRIESIHKNEIDHWNFDVPGHLL
ncbi:sulfotransferase family 2 domain-containing protein [Salinibacter sp.]|uniref:sulfotransferase family 2 domain-containing protein n=1 Tax=Salinibacter sp. TaxID=2065818 RepID=UPI0021E7CFC6|nr:sulfotransferase family 2 domain-containing protein [Salinibacter sp.]